MPHAAGNRIVAARTKAARFMVMVMMMFMLMVVVMSAGALRGSCGRRGPALNIRLIHIKFFRHDLLLLRGLVGIFFLRRLRLRIQLDPDPFPTVAGPEDELVFLLGL